MVCGEATMEHESQGKALRAMRYTVKEPDTGPDGLSVHVVLSMV